MKTCAFITAGLLASLPSIAFAQQNQVESIALSAAQMDSVTAGMFQLPAPYATITAVSTASGKQAMTGTFTSANVVGHGTTVQYGYGRNWIISSNALATATGDESRSTSYSSSDDSNGTTPLGQVISRSITVGPTQISGYSSVQPSGVLTYNMLQRVGTRFFPN
ncbi:MAG: hypothetical protein H6991_02345 [Pseudomonadales bacterium]|nr:hypothetical protein [Pseudomonadales bacterium]